jgi:adenylate kinase family enzyme
LGKGGPKRSPGIIIIGPPGSGRSTQARLLARELGLVRVSVKDLINEEIKNNIELG